MKEFLVDLKVGEKLFLRMRVGTKDSRQEVLNLPSVLITFVI